MKKNYNDDKYLFARKIKNKNSDTNKVFEFEVNNLTPLEEIKLIKELIDYLNIKFKEELNLLHSDNIDELIEYDKKLRENEDE